MELRSDKDLDVINLRKASLNLLLDRYQRIREERKYIIRLFMGLSGGAIVLSITFLDNLAPNKAGLALLFGSWMAFSLAALIGLIALVLFNRVSIAYQLELHRQFLEGRLMPESPVLSGNYIGETSGSTFRYKWVEVTVGVLFLLGAMLLAAFAVMNLLA